jgi:DNA polymerase-3 subunit epsilon
MHTGGGRSPLTVRDVAERHGGEVWIEHDRSGAGPFFRFLLPVVTSEPATRPTTAPAPAGARPEYYDFDLFAGGRSSPALDERLLSDISYTVFDTETTGLDPAGGDEILQIGAARIVNGKLLRGERFDQLVDPNRSIPEASTRIHGIGPEQVRGKPSIADVLPAFHAFIGDTVLVGHNVAFDLRFLKLKEAASGQPFDQPVLDTLLLSSVVHPTEPSHGLETIAARLGVTTSSRHTALGDALVTGELFLKLLPLLAQRGILTLSQAREAARTSYYARLRY